MIKATGAKAPALSGVEQMEARGAHNPEIVGSNPTPAICANAGLDYILARNNTSRQLLVAQEASGSPLYKRSAEAKPSPGYITGG